MSMQLQFNSGQHVLSTWHIPTTIAYMILTDKRGFCRSHMNGKAARRALSVYQIWAEQSEPFFWPKEVCGSFLKCVVNIY